MAFLKLSIIVIASVQKGLSFPKLVSSKLHQQQTHPASHNRDYSETTVSLLADCREPAHCRRACSEESLLTGELTGEPAHCSLAR